MVRAAAVAAGGGVTKVIYRDQDGNEISFGGGAG
jgi:hypothetical protein